METKLGEIELTIQGPNLSSAMQAKGTVHVHAAGCSDLKRNYDERTEMLSGFFGSVEDVVTEVYAEIKCDECGECEFVLDLVEARERGWEIHREADWCYECATTTKGSLADSGVL
jgi:hypothetical protein